MKILEQMLAIETEARQIVEDAKNEANAIRKKAREDAKQLVITGKHDLQHRVQQEVTLLEQEAEKQKEQIVSVTKTRISETERMAKERIERTVEHVISQFLHQYVSHEI